jgi:hypothetical protein
MRSLPQLILIVTALATSYTHARVIYGDDHRLEVHEASTFQQQLARSAATMISQSKMSQRSDGLITLEQTSLRQWLESQTAPDEMRPQSLLSASAVDAVQAKVSFCSDERFVEQPNPGMCSGFLIAPDLIMTAGHCVELENFCSEYRWVFDFKVDAQTQEAGLAVRPEDIYSCKRVITNALNMSLMLDHAIIQLDRPVFDRTPLTLRTTGSVSETDELMVIGSPSGLPLKVAAGAKVRKNEHPFYFSANLDTFQGNSGSAVFNASTGIVEGVLVRGEEDFVFNGLNKCVEANKCGDGECRGEDISRITSVPELALMELLHEAAGQGDLRTLSSVASLNIWIDIYTADGKSALIKAATQGQLEAMELLLKRGAEVNLQDAQGMGAIHLVTTLDSKKILPVLELLLASGADVELRDYAFETPLMKAVRAKNLKAVEVLLQRGASTVSQNQQGKTALDIAQELRFSRIANRLRKIN